MSRPDVVETAVVGWFSETPMHNTGRATSTHRQCRIEMVDRRNADFHEISRRLRFSDGTDQTGEYGLFDTHVLIWMVRFVACAVSCVELTIPHWQAGKYS